jgi:subtilisin family serine protease
MWILKFVCRLLFFAVFILPSFVWAQADEVIPGEYIVKFKRQRNASQVNNKMNGKAQLKGALGRGEMFHFKANQGQESIVEDLKNDPDVEYVEPNYVLHLSDDDGPPGQLLEILSTEQIQSTVTTQATGDCPTGVTSGCYRQTGTRLYATEAWAAALPYAANNRPIVAVIDTGVDVNHFVFSQTGAIWTNPNEISGNNTDDDGNGYRDDTKGWNFVSNSNNVLDDEGHGTHVAGIILGATMDVLAPQASITAPSKIRIMPLKFLDATGSGATSAAISAIYYAVNNGAKVINNSWGGGSYSRALHDAMTYAYNHGVLVVSAAGNYTSNNDVTAMYPANYDVPSNTSIAAVYDSGNLASFSNYGATTVHVGAPGSLVYSTVPGNQFGLMSGTSMAAPVVAGAAALAWREAPQLSGYQMRGLIMASKAAIANLSGKVITGGRLDVLGLLNATKLQSLTAASQPSYSPQYKAESTASSGGGDSGGGGGGGGCGMIAPMDENNKMGPGAGGNALPNSMLMICLLLPIIMWFALRQQAPKYKRAHERFRMNSNIQIKVGERELTGEMQTIGVGGLSFNVDEALEKGGIVTMKIASPDGKDIIEVEGRIVWNEKNEAYGVQFARANQTIVERITSWTRKVTNAA